MVWVNIRLTSCVALETFVWLCETVVVRWFCNTSFAQTMDGRLHGRDSYIFHILFCRRFLDRFEFCCFSGFHYFGCGNKMPHFFVISHDPKSDDSKRFGSDGRFSYTRPPLPSTSPKFNDSMTRWFDVGIDFYGFLRIS